MITMTMNYGTAQQLQGTYNSEAKSGITGNMTPIAVPINNVEAAMGQTLLSRSARKDVRERFGNTSRVN